MGMELSVASLLLRLVTDGRVSRNDTGVNIFEYCWVLSQGVVPAVNFFEDRLYSRYVFSRKQLDRMGCLSSSESLNSSVEDLIAWSHKQGEILPISILPKFKETQELTILGRQTVTKVIGYFRPYHLNMFRLDPGNLFFLKEELTQLPIVMSLPILSNNSWESLSRGNPTISIPQRIPYVSSQTSPNLLKSFRIFPDYIMAQD